MIWDEILSTLLLCQFFVRCQVPLRLSALPWLPTIWSSASAHQLYSARTFKGLRLCFRNSALSLLPKIRSSAFRTSARPGLRNISIFFRTCSTRTSKYGYVQFRISSLPGLPKMRSSVSALLLCLDCQRSEVPLSVLPLGHDFERSRSSSTLVLSGLPSMGKSTSAFHLCRNIQRCKVALPHVCAALTAKDLKFRFPYFRSARTRKISFIFHSCSARTSKYG